MYNGFNFRAHFKYEKLTYNSKIDFHVPCRSILEVHPAPVDSSIGSDNVVQHQNRWSGGTTEERTVAEDGGGRPQLRLVNGPAANVVADERQKHNK